jgi:hypothetical protein
MLGREHLAGPSHARLHFVGDEQHSMLAGQIAEPLQKLRRCDHVPALSLNRLDENRRDFVGSDQVHEQLVLDEVEALRAARLRRQAGRTPVALGIRRVIDARHERTEATPLHRFTGRHCQRAHRAAVESAEERDDVRPSGREPGQLEGRFDRFGA